jgi:hypothetical protein
LPKQPTSASFSIKGVNGRSLLPVHPRATVVRTGIVRMVLPVERGSPRSSPKQFLRPPLIERPIGGPPLELALMRNDRMENASATC